jgi:hemerythrin-like domain-containing protein
MLTATYSLITISAEQRNSRSILSRLQEYIRICLKKIQAHDLINLRAAFEKIAQFDQYCHARKMELYVIPSIRGMTEEVDSLIEELESISARGIDILRSAQEKLRNVFEQGVSQLSELCRSMDVYCENLLQRLAKEEEELLPMVQRSLGNEGWFRIAEKLLTDDAYTSKRRNAVIATA